MTAHNHQPNQYYKTMSSHTPVLHIASGDRVITACVDARGFDAFDQQVTRPSNPLTGPFFIHGAEPGDMLVVKLERITPSRRRGWSGWLLASNVVDSQDVAELARADVSTDPWNWDVDIDAHVVRLNHPSSPWHGRSLGLDPMLGCLGVAADRGQAITTTTSSTHGGNMDYRGFRAGCTTYFPVFEPGALFFLGDGHAVQGDGEFIGTGVEISMKVEFSVQVVKHQPIHCPRGEDKQYIFTVGNARPLDQCVQHANSEMLRWLMNDYGLDIHHASLLMGLGAKYDLANMLNPAYTMICKMPKAVLTAFNVERQSSRILGG